MALKTSVGVLVALSILFYGGRAPAAEAGKAAPAAPQARQQPEKEETAEAKARVEDTAIPVSLDELKVLLKRPTAPRVAVATKFATVTGKAVRVEKGKVFVDVTGENVALDGVLGVEIPRILSIKVLVPLTEAQRRAAEEATARYLAGLKAAAKKPKTQPPAPAAEQEQPGPKEVREPAPAKAAEELPEAKRDLLAIYPPEQGWGPKRLTEIMRKTLVLHLPPAGKEKTFGKDYAAWAHAYNKKRNEQLEQRAAYESMGEKPPADFKVLPELPPVPSLEGAPPGLPSGAPAGDASDGEPVGMASEPTGQ